MKHWLMKSEPSVFGIDDLAKAPRRTSGWDGVRNYQVRNMLRDEFAVGDLAFFYHSSCPEPGSAGVIKVERPDAGDWSRRWGPFVDGVSLYPA
jgi:predicted RNA-binding protein with PUA-like domain